MQCMVVCVFVFVSVCVCLCVCVYECVYVYLCAVKMAEVDRYKLLQSQFRSGYTITTFNNTVDKGLSVVFLKVSTDHRNPTPIFIVEIHRKNKVR